MLKAIALLICALILVHFYTFFQTAHLDPCDAAFSKIEYEHVNVFKHKRRELMIDQEDQELYDSIAHRDILRCYKILLFRGEG